MTGVNMQKNCETTTACEQEQTKTSKHWNEYHIGVWDKTLKWNSSETNTESEKQLFQNKTIMTEKLKKYFLKTVDTFLPTN